MRISLVCSPVRISPFPSQNTGAGRTGGREAGGAAELFGWRLGEPGWGGTREDEEEDIVAVVVVVVVFVDFLLFCGPRWGVSSCFAII